MAKIQKCLRLSKSTNPHEAALALKQAYALMKKHNISENIVEGCEYMITGKEVQSHNTQQFPNYLNMLLNIIKRTFTVTAILRTRLSKTYIVFYGDESDVMIAEYAYTFLTRLLVKARTEYIRSLSKKTISRATKTMRGDVFAKGWALGVSSELKTLRRYNDDEYQAAQDKVEAYRDDLTGKLEIAKTKDSPDINHRTVAAYNSGYEAGGKVSITKAVNNTEQKYIK